MKQLYLILVPFAFGFSSSARVENIQSMVKNGSSFDVFCDDGSNEVATPSQITSNQVCETGSNINEIRDACDSAFTGSTNEDRCFQLARHYKMNAAQIFACEDAFSNDTNELQCVEAAGRSRLAADGIFACEDAFSNDTNELQCVQYAVGLTAKEINLCELEFTNDTNELQCVEIAGRKGLNYQDIQYCVDEEPSDSTELQCMEDFL